MNISSHYFLCLCLMVMLTAVSSLSADTTMPRVDMRQKQQQQLIRRGINSGQISPIEAKGLVEQQVRIKRAEALSTADGIITDKERALLAHQQNKARRTITRKKFNEQKLDGVLDQLHFRR